MRVLETPLGRGEEPGNSPGRNLLGQGSAALAQLDDPAQKLLPGARRVRKRKSASFHSVFARTGSAEGLAQPLLPAPSWLRRRKRQLFRKSERQPGPRRRRRRRIGSPSMGGPGRCTASTSSTCF